MRQHTTPIVVEKGSARRLEKIHLGKEGYTESWLQAEIDRNPTVLPIEEIEPAYANPISLCRELPTESGFCDNVFINESGYLTIVECKLWKNPEARRKVIAQILDYAKDISQWSYDQLDQNVMKARGEDRSLFDLIGERHPDIEQAEFIDSVQRSMASAKFLLLVVGDGVRANAENLTEFLKKFGSLSFSLALVELPLYRMSPDSVLIAPRVLLQTTEIVRSVVRIEDQRIVQPDPAPEDKIPLTQTEMIFYERLAKSSGSQVAGEFKIFVQSLQDRLGCIAKMGRGKRMSLNIKSGDERLNFASIQETGEVWFYGIILKTGDIGRRDIGVRYLTELSELVGGVLDDSTDEWVWAVRKGGKYLPLKIYLEQKIQWESLITEIINEIREHEESNS